MSTEDQDPPIATAAKGAGVMPFGSGPAGTATIATAAASPKPSAGSRHIDHNTKDYVISNATSQQGQMPVARQKVLLALTTKRGSSTANPRFGLQAPTKRGKRFANEMRAAVRSALSHLTLESRPVIHVRGIKVEVPKGGRAVVTVSYVDLLTGATDTAGAIV